MSEALVSLTIDGNEVSVPKGTLLVDAAKKVGIEIPVFCYHPKFKPVGMCRMCLVEVGRPSRDRATGELAQDDDGQPVINFGPNLETSCTLPVGEGWVVRVNSERAREARKQMLEFLLSSHPLDCPICDKGGECPLQNLTMKHGPGESRFLISEKMHLDKHVPLGELIFLDQERCIQCARCIRFQEEIVGDPVIGFTERGRRLKIITSSEPGFDSYFSGNTTDICPVGALTTADFRFGARPWELRASASICPHCPVGCNLTLNSRREASSEGRETVKRVMPRQNEAVNEIWICDKGRFAHHFAGSSSRLLKPMVRIAGKLVEVKWEDALAHAAKGLQEALSESSGDRHNLVGIAGGRAANEDLFTFRRMVEALDGRVILDDNLAGGDLMQQVGVSRGTNLGDLGPGDAVLVVASDLHEEAPLWWLRIKRAAEKGATLVVANARPTRLDVFATHKIRYPFGKAAQAALGLLHNVNGQADLASFAEGESLQAASKSLIDARDLIIIYGREGLDYDASEALARACANLLVATKHVGRENNGLIAVWPRNNTQGAWDMGLRPDPDGLQAALKGSAAVYVMAADPAGDDAGLADVLRDNAFMVVQELFLTSTAMLADVVFPAQSFVEREGTFTSGERRVQRFYPAVKPRGESQPDWRIIISLAELLGVEIEAISAAGIMSEISKVIPEYADLTYQALARVEPQWPPVGGNDLYYSGTAFKNRAGLGIQLTPGVLPDEPFEIPWTIPVERPQVDGLLLVPVTYLYDGGTTITPSVLLQERSMSLNLMLNPGDADRMGVKDGEQVEFRWNGRTTRLPARVGKDVPEGAALLPRSLGLPVQTPMGIKVKPVG